MPPTSLQEPRYALEWDAASIIRARLLWGTERAQTIGQLADMTHLTRRQVEQALEELVSSGSHPIVAGPRGVWLEADPAAVDAYADALLRRCRSQYRRIAGVRRCARAMRSIEQPTLGLIA